MTGTTILDVIASPGLGAYFFDDQAAIKAGARRDGLNYLGETLTPGYRAIREPAESVSMMLILDDGYVAVGDCASVQYSGVGGREPRFHAHELAQRIESELAPRLLGRDVSQFRSQAENVEHEISSIDGLGRATAYGVSQALLNAAAHSAGHHLMARIIKDEWNLPNALAAVPVYGQTGEDRHGNVDKLVLKQVPILPHGLINTPELVGDGGETLVEYIQWIRGRIGALSPDPTYLPVIHLDVYGMIGVVADGDLDRAATIIQALERAAGPHQLRIEHPVHARSRDAQIEVSTHLRRELRERGATTQLIADEWANTIDDVRMFAQAGATDLIQIKTPDLGSIHNTVQAILDCHWYGVGTVLGGTCAETDQSARTTTHIGIATAVTQMLAKPGMGVDEGLSIVTNEMNRALRLDRHLTEFEQRANRVRAA